MGHVLGRRLRRRPRSPPWRIPASWWFRQLQLGWSAKRRERLGSQTSRPPASAPCPPRPVPDPRATSCPGPRWPRRMSREWPPWWCRRTRTGRPRRSRPPSSTAVIRPPGGLRRHAGRNWALSPGAAVRGTVIALATRLRRTRMPGSGVPQFEPQLRVCGARCGLQRDPHDHHPQRRWLKVKLNASAVASSQSRPATVTLGANPCRSRPAERHAGGHAQRSGRQCRKHGRASTGSGNIVLSNQQTTLRVPYLLVPRAVSKVSTSLGTPLSFSAPSTATVTNVGGVIGGTADLYQWGLQDGDDINEAALGGGGYDMRAVGVQSFVDGATRRSSSRSAPMTDGPPGPSTSTTSWSIPADSPVPNTP